MTFKERVQQFFFFMITLGSSMISMSLLAEGHFFEAFIALLPASAGGFLLHRSRKKALKRIEKERELRILRLLDESEGRFSLGKLALKMRLSVEEIEETMDYLVNKGVIEVNNDINGTIVYALPQRSSRALDY